MRPENLNRPGIVKNAMSLEEELAQKIKKREEKIVETTLEHARQQGADLLRAKQHLGQRKFAPWVKANCGFSRQTAYTYMKVASEWDAICQGALQMASLQEFVRKLFGEGKAKKKSKHGTAPKRDPEDSRPVEETIADSEAGEKIETPSDSEQGANHEPDHDQLAPEQEQQEKPDDQSCGLNTTEDEDKPSKETSKKSRRDSSQENGEGAASNDKNNFVIPIKDPRVNDYLHGMIDDVLKARRKRGFCERIYPEQIRDFVIKEDFPARIILELVQFEFDLDKRCKYI